MGMGNGTGVLTIEWVVAGVGGLAVAVFGWFNKVTHARLNRHGEELKRHGEQLARLTQIHENQVDVNKEIKDGVRGMHKRLDDLVQHGCKRGVERHGPDLN